MRHVHRVVATRAAEPVDLPAFRRELMTLHTRYLGTDAGYLLRLTPVAPAQATR